MVERAALGEIELALQHPQALAAEKGVHAEAGKGTRTPGGSVTSTSSGSAPGGETARRR